MRVLFDVDETDQAYLDIKAGGRLLYDNYAVTTTCPIDVGFSKSELVMFGDDPSLLTGNTPTNFT